MLLLAWFRLVPRAACPIRGRRNRRGRSGRRGLVVGLQYEPGVVASVELVGGDDLVVPEEALAVDLGETEAKKSPGEVG